MADALDRFLDEEAGRYVARLREKKPRGVHLPETQKKKRGAPEQVIQRAIVADIRANLQNGVVGASISTAQGSGDAEQRARYGARLKSFGVWAGDPDLHVFLQHGVTVLLEVKAEDGRLSDKQKGAHLLLQELGHPVYVVRSIDEARAALIRHGAVFRGSMRRATPVQPLESVA